MSENSRYVDEILAESFRRVNINEWWKELLSEENYKFCENAEKHVENLVDNLEFDFNAAISGMPWGESYAAELISNKFEKTLGFDYDQSIWYLWNGIVHMPMENPLAVEEIMERFLNAYEKAYDFAESMSEKVADAIEAEAGSESGKAKAKRVRDDFKKEFTKHKTFRDRLRGPEGRNKVISDLKRKLAVNPRKFEDDTDWFVFRNGVINCKRVREEGVTEEILPHDPSRNVTRFFDAEYDEENDLGHWTRFLERSIPDPEVREYVHACVGAAFTGNTKLRTFLVFEGERSSGKSLFLEVMAELGRRSDPRIDGSSYVNGNANSNAIIRKKGGSNFAQSEFGNNRIVGVSEPNAREELDGEFIKAYTGDRTVSTEKKHKDFHADIAQGLLIIATNEMPRMNSMDTAIMKRAKIVKFPYSFVDSPDPTKEHEKESVENLRELLLEDRSSILRWILDGMELHKNGRNKNNVSYNRLEDSAPAIMDQWSEEHKSDLQTPISWMETMIAEGAVEYESNPDVLVNIPRKDLLPIGDAYVIYKHWCVYEGAGTPMGNRNFSKLLMDFYKVEGHDKTIQSGVRRFPVFTQTPQFEKLLVKAKESTY